VIGRTAYNALRFVEVPGDQYINPSHASPLNVDCKEVIKDRKFVLLRNGRPLIAVMSGSVEWSQLTTLGSKPVKLKFICVGGHSQEWERYSGFMCMVLPKDPIYGHIWLNALQFSTRSVPIELKKPRIPSLFTLPHDSSGNVEVGDPYSLPYTAEGMVHVHSLIVMLISFL
jgi:hypothetical protein